MAVKWGEKLLLYLFLYFHFFQGNVAEFWKVMSAVTMIFASFCSEAWFFISYIRLSFSLCTIEPLLYMPKKDLWSKFHLGPKSQTSRQVQSGIRAKIHSWSMILSAVSQNPEIQWVYRKNSQSVCFLRPNPLIQNPIHPLLSFNSLVALILTPITNVLLFGWIVSTTGEFTRNIKDPSNILTGPFSCIFSATWLARDVKEPAHLSKRVRDIIPGVVVYLCLWFHLTVHAWIGWVGGWDLIWTDSDSQRRLYKLTCTSPNKEL